VAAAVAGDQHPFGLLVEAQWDRLVRLARSVVGPLEAEDVVQESLMAAWRALPQLDDGAKFAGWMCRIVVRRCLKRQHWWRRRGVAPNGQRSVGEGSDPSPAAGPASAPDGWLLVWQVPSRVPP
jgi:RNA polymerase sigma-70 factor (ECF subfamily)